LALFRIAAAAGVLLVLAPEKTREAALAIFRGADEARQAAPTKEQIAETAMTYCRKHPEVCAEALRKAGAADKRLLRP
jgi:hypothetical protein